MISPNYCLSRESKQHTWRPKCLVQKPNKWCKNLPSKRIAWFLVSIFTHWLVPLKIGCWPRLILGLELTAVKFSSFDFPWTHNNYIWCDNDKIRVKKLYFFKKRRYKSISLNSADCFNANGFSLTWPSLQICKSSIWSIWFVQPNWSW